MLYELLAGVLPAESEARNLAQLVEGGHPPPSHRLRALDAARLETAAIARRTRPRPLVRSLEGELDGIVGKALAPDPEARYAGVAALAEDLRRHLRAEPVPGGSGGLGHRLGRLARRHPLGTAVVALVLLALVLGLAAVLW
jgi:hypothetical protein